MVAVNVHAVFAAILLVILGGLMDAGCEDADAAPADPYLPNVHIFTFQKDEVEVLADWVAYHVRLVGPQNLHVIDNNSTEPAILEVLHAMRSAGIQVVDFDGPFIRKGPRLTHLMQQVRDDDASAEFLVPLDVDEFIVAMPSGSSAALADAASIQAAFAELPRDGHKVKMGRLNALYCDQGAADDPAVSRRVLNARYWTHTQPAYGCLSKTIFLARGFLGTDSGNHVGYVEADTHCSERQDLMQCSFLDREHCFHERKQLALVHYGDTAMTWQAYLRKMVRTAEAFAYTSEAIRAGEVQCSDKMTGEQICRFMARLVEVGEEPLRKEFLAKFQDQCAEGKLQMAVADELLRLRPLDVSANR